MASAIEESTVAGEPHQQEQSTPDDSQVKVVYGRDEDGPSPTTAPVSNNLVMLSAVIFPFAGCVAAVIVTWMFGWMGWLYLGLLIGGCVLTELGITVAFHRLLSHKAYETTAPVKAFFTALGAMAVEGSPTIWCAVHRRHHQYSDLEGDPHSPHVHDGGWWNAMKGFAYAHTGWLFTKYWSHADAERYVPDLMRDPVVSFIHRKYYLFVLLSLALPAAIAGLVTWSWQGALLGFLWGGLVRTFLSHHITWSINSVCHVFGRRDFKSADLSTNNWLFALLGVGEGWHNNHHAFPTSACFGLKWWQFDLGWVVIRSLQMVGLAWDVRVPDAATQQAKAIKPAAA